MSDTDAILREYKIYMAARISNDIIANEIKYALRPMADSFSYQLTAMLGVAGDEMDFREWPTTWWDAFKKRWYPMLAIRRWPYHMSRIEVRTYYPLVKLPEMTNTVRIVDIR